MFTKALNHGSFIQILPSSKLTSPSLKQITIMGWIRPDSSDEGTVLVIVGIEITTIMNQSLDELEQRFSNWGTPGVRL
jgi:hypothetical protein